MNTSCPLVPRPTSLPSSRICPGWPSPRERPWSCSSCRPTATTAPASTWPPGPWCGPGRPTPSAHRLRPYDVVAVTLDEDFDGVPDPHEPEALVAGRPSRAGAAARRPPGAAHAAPLAAPPRAAVARRVVVGGAVLGAPARPPVHRGGRTRRSDQPVAGGPATWPAGSAGWATNASCPAWTATWPRLMDRSGRPASGRRQGRPPAGRPHPADRRPLPQGGRDAAAPALTSPGRSRSGAGPQGEYLLARSSAMAQPKAMSTSPRSWSRGSKKAATSSGTVSGLADGEVEAARRRCRRR